MLQLTFIINGLMTGKSSKFQEFSFDRKRRHDNNARLDRDLCALLVARMLMVN